MWSLRALQKALLCCCRKEPTKCHCRPDQSSQSSSLTLPLEREAGLDCQTHHSWLFALKHLLFSSWCCRIAPFTVPHSMWHWTFVTVSAQKWQLLKFGDSFKHKCLRERDRKTDSNLSERAEDQIQILRRRGREWQCLLSLRAWACWRTSPRCLGRTVWDTRLSSMPSTSYKVTSIIANLAEQSWCTLECNAWA